MGWWSTGHGDDASGDGPADTMQACLTSIAASRVEKRQAKPTLEKLLTAMVQALNARSATIIQDGTSVHIRKLEARLEPDSMHVSSGNTADEGVVKALGDAFAAIAREYNDVLDRRPRLSELLYAVRFVLGYEPERYLSIDPGTSIKEITAQLD